MFDPHDVQKSRQDVPLQDEQLCWTFVVYGFLCTFAMLVWMSLDIFVSLHLRNHGVAALLSTMFHIHI